MDSKENIEWLLEGDVAIQYQVHRDLLDIVRNDLQQRIACEGWGKTFLSLQNENGHWGRGFYQPKWTSTHYTLLDLKNLAISAHNQQIKKSINMVLDQEKGPDGGIDPSRTRNISDVCVTGMVLNYASYFKVEPAKLESIVDYLLLKVLPDGGYNCDVDHREVRHSSLHSTLSVLEGILEYEQNGYTYRLNELKNVQTTSQEFILKHKFFLSDRTGEIIKKDFLKFSYPPRWHYNILRALDYFRKSGASFDPRMQNAIDVLLKKRTKQGSWLLQSHHPGQIHFEMEKVGQPSRWNTMQALRVFKYFGINGDII